VNYPGFARQFLVPKNTILRKKNKYYIPDGSDQSDILVMRAQNKIIKIQQLSVSVKIEQL
jgi:hypothetical protein